MCDKCFWLVYCLLAQIYVNEVCENTICDLCFRSAPLIFEPPQVPCTRFFCSSFNFFNPVFPNCPRRLNLTSTHYPLANSNFIGGSEACRIRESQKTVWGSFFWWFYKSYLSHFVGPQNGQLNKCLVWDSMGYY